MRELIEATLRRAASVHESLIAQIPAIEEVGRRLVDVFRAGRSVYVMGNGGSAADSQHMAAELVGRFQMDRAPLPCQALTTDTSLLTAVANDCGFDQVFARQVAALVRPGDAVIGISTSGNSPDVLLGIEEASRRGVLTIGLTGGSGGALSSKCDLAIAVQAQEAPRIQEAHGVIIHILCDLVERSLFGSDR